MNINSGLTSQIPPNSGLSSLAERPPSKTAEPAQGPAVRSEALSNTLSSTDPGLSTVAALPQRKDNDAEWESFEGENKILIMPPSVTTERMQAIIDRLPPEQGRNLIDIGLLEKDAFVTFASELNDEDLHNFAKTALALQTQSKIGQYTLLGASGTQGASKLMESLSRLDNETRSRALQLAAELSDKVPVRDVAATYDAEGLITGGSPSANDLHNFVNALSAITGPNPTAETASMLDQLAEFTQNQQPDLLHLLGRDLSMATRLMDSLSDYSQQTQDSVFSYLSELSQTASPFSGRSEGSAMVAGVTWHGAVLNHDDSDRSVVFGMIDTIISLTENYTFSDEQLDAMANDLKALDSTHQRAYIEITRTGLDTLAAGNPDPPYNLRDNTATLKTIDMLRSDSHVRELVATSRLGEKRTSDGHTFYELKDAGSGQRDQQQTIELLTKDAWLHQGDATRAAKLARNLNQLEAGPRDHLITELNTLNTGGKGMAHSTSARLAEDFAALLARTNPIIQSHNITALITLETGLPETHKEPFWQAADMVEDEVDSLVQALAAVEASKIPRVLETLASLAELVDTQQLPQDGAKVLATTLLDKITAASAAEQNR